MIHIFANKLGWVYLEILIEQFQTRFVFLIDRIYKLNYENSA